MDVLRYLGSSRHCPKTIVSFDAWRYAYFVVMLVAIYLIVRGVGDSGIVDWDMRDKNVDQNFQDILALIILGTLVFVFGNYANTFSGWTAGAMLVIALVWMVVSNIKALESSLVSIKTWSPEIWAAIGILAAIIVSGLVYVLWQGYGCAVLWRLLIPAVAFVAILVTSYLLKGDATFHLHHWMIFWTLAFLAPFDAPLAQMAGGAALGIFASALSQYGPDSIVPGPEDAKAAPWLEL